MKKIITITLDTAKMSREEKRLTNEFVTDERIRTTGAGGRTTILNMLDSGHATMTITEEGRIWVAGWNVPGYLPEAEPREFDSWHDACSYLVDELEDDMEGIIAGLTASDDSKKAGVRAQYQNAMAYVTDRSRAVSNGKRNAQPEPFWVQCGSYAWWIAQEQ